MARKLTFRITDGKGFSIIAQCSRVDQQGENISLTLWSKNYFHETYFEFDNSFLCDVISGNSESNAILIKTIFLYSIIAYD